tara:strand:+ start:158077 stop:159186 length:1110 start_codon:yes stop_codon:yes gene_type:complete
MIKKIIQAFPLLYATLIFYGYLVKASFYGKFDIKVYDYLSVDELLIPIFDISTFLLVFAPILMPFLLIRLLGKKRIRKLLGQTLNKQKKNSKERNIQKIKKGFRISNLLSLLFLSSWPIILIVLLRHGYYTLLSWNLIICFLSTIWFIILCIFLWKKKEEYFSYPLNTIFILFIFLHIIILTLYVQTMKAENIFQGKPLAKIQVSWDKGTIISNDTLIFIGKTKDYIFFRNLYLEETLILNMSSITQHTIYWDHSKIFTGDIGLAPRNWDKHPFFSVINWDSEISEEIIAVKPVQGSVILNSKFVLPWYTRIEYKESIPKWIKYEKSLPLKTPVLENIDVPYKIIKKGNQMEFHLIKNKDTVLMTFKKF